MSDIRTNGSHLAPVGLAWSPGKVAGVSLGATLSLALGGALLLLRLGALDRFSAAVASACSSSSISSVSCKALNLR